MRIEAEVRFVPKSWREPGGNQVFAIAYCDDDAEPWHPPWKGPERKGLAWAMRDLRNHNKEFHQVQLNLFDQEVQ